MAIDDSDASGISGALRSAHGKGVVRLEIRLDAEADDVWSAITSPSRLAGWYGQVDGDLWPGGQFHIYIEADDWEGTGRVEVCEPPRRLRVTTRESEESWRKGQGAAPFDATVDASLTARGDQTMVVAEVRGMPLDKLAAYGAGWQIHAENLAAYLAGRGRGDIEARWAELIPIYQARAASIDE